MLTGHCQILPSLLFENLPLTSYISCSFQKDKKLSFLNLVKSFYLKLRWRTEFLKDDLETHVRDILGIKFKLEANYHKVHVFICV